MRLGASGLHLNELNLQSLSLKDLAPSLATSDILSSIRVVRGPKKGTYKLPKSPAISDMDIELSEKFIK